MTRADDIWMDMAVFHAELDENAAQLAAKLGRKPTPEELIAAASHLKSPVPPSRPATSSTHQPRTRSRTSPQSNNRRAAPMTLALAKSYAEWKAGANRCLINAGKENSDLAYLTEDAPALALADILSFILPSDIHFNRDHGAVLHPAALMTRMTEAERFLIDSHPSLDESVEPLNKGDCLSSDPKDFRAARKPSSARTDIVSRPHPAPASPAPSPTGPRKARSHYHRKNTVLWMLCDQDARDALALRSKSWKLQSKWIEDAVTRSSRQLPRASVCQHRALDTLRESFPNFGEVIDVIARALTLQRHCKAAVRLPPMLLVGPPGIGKTEFGRRLADVLDLHMSFRSLAETSAGFVLIGSNSQWGKAQPGAVAELVIRCPDRKAPLLMLDELDKVRSGGDRWPVDQVLLGLLEPGTNGSFRDEYLDVEMNIRPLSFLLTANRLAGIRPEILSRLRVIHVPPPTQAQMPAVVRSLDRAVRQSTPGLKRFFKPLGDEVIGALSGVSPRELRRKLEDAYALALDADGSRRRRVITAEHLSRASRPNDAGSTASMSGDRRPVLPILVEPRGWQWIQ